MSGSPRLIPWLALAVFLASCSREPEAPAVPATGAPQAQAASRAVQDPAATSVAAVAVGTTALPLTIRFDIPAAPLVGQPAKVTLTIATAQPLEHVEIDSSSAALQIDEATAKLALDGLEPGKPRQVDLAFTPQSAGLADVELDVRVQTESGPLQSRYAIPVLSTTAAPAPGG
jgi:hypothetical protein